MFTTSTGVWKLILASVRPVSMTLVFLSVSRPQEAKFNAKGDRRLPLADRSGWVTEWHGDLKLVALRLLGPALLTLDEGTVDAVARMVRLAVASDQQASVDSLNDRAVHAIAVDSAVASADAAWFSQILQEMNSAGESPVQVQALPSGSGVARVDTGNVTRDDTLLTTILCMVFFFFCDHSSFQIVPSSTTTKRNSARSPLTWIRSKRWFKSSMDCTHSPCVVCRLSNWMH